MSFSEKRVPPSRVRYMEINKAILERNEKKFFTNVTPDWGKRLRAARLAAKKSQAEIADEADLHVAWIGRAENEQVVKLPRDAVERLGKALKFDADWLIGGDGEAPPGAQKYLEELPPAKPKVKLKSGPKLVAGEYVVQGWGPDKETPSPLPARMYPADLIEQLPEQIRPGLLWAYHKPGEQQLNTEGGDIVLVTTHHMQNRNGWRFFHDPIAGKRWLRYCKTVQFIDDDDGTDGMADAGKVQTAYVAAPPDDLKTFESFEAMHSEAFLLHRQSFELKLPISEDGWPRPVKVTRQLQETLAQEWKILSSGD